MRSTLSTMILQAADHSAAAWVTKKSTNPDGLDFMMQCAPSSSPAGKSRWISVGGGNAMPAISKDVFCKALALIKEQEAIDESFSKALQTVGNGFLAFGAENKYLEALLQVLKEAMGDKYDYIDWWLYDTSDFKVYSADGKETWDLKEPADLYDYIITEGQK